MMQAAANPDAFCDRCHAPMRLAAKRNEESFPFKLATVPKGFCANCIVTVFLYNTYPVNEILDRSGPQILLVPHMRQAFAPIVEKSDMNIDEISWELVVKNWTLPVKQKKGPKNPYRMGEHAEREQLRKQHEAAKAIIGVPIK